MRQDQTRIHSIRLSFSRHERLLDEKWVMTAASGILKSVRDLLNLQKREVARLTGISHFRYRLLEKGNLVPTADEWLRICEAIGIPLSSLESGFLYDSEISQVLRSKKSRVRWREREPGVYRPRGDYRFLRRNALSLNCGDLSFARFAWAEIPRSSFDSAILTGTSFAWADLTGAHFEGACLKGAQLGGAKLLGANLHNVDLEKAHLMLASFDSSTKLPFSREEAFLRGMIEVNRLEKSVFETEFPSSVISLDRHRDFQTS